MTGWSPFPAQAQPAGALRRMGAYFIDALAIGATIGLLEELLGANWTMFAQFQAADGTVSEMAMPTVAGAVATLVVNLLYSAGLEASPVQGTAGKLLMGCMVTDVAGQRLSFGRAVARWLAKLVSGLVLMLGYLMIPFHPQHCGLHDLLAGTRVVVGRV